MARRSWMDEPHEFRENGNDYSMCLCGIPGTYHDEWGRRMSEQSERSLIGTQQEERDG